jgi:hypothetical protein
LVRVVFLVLFAMCAFFFWRHISWRQYWFWEFYPILIWISSFFKVVVFNFSHNIKALLLSVSLKVCTLWALAYIRIQVIWLSLVKVLVSGLYQM